MFEITTKDGHKVCITYSANNPSEPKGGMQVGTRCWFHLQDKWRLSDRRNGHHLKKTMENNTLNDILDFYISQDLRSTMTRLFNMEESR